MSKIALCRCGQSRSKPFCDGNHKAVGFQADDLAPRK
jgi:CDGSH-type Zn-finger protein